MNRRVFIIGGGNFGSQLGRRLAELGADVTIAERNPKRTEELAREGFHVLELDAEDESALVQAGVQNADVVVISIGENLQGSIITTLALNELKVKRIVARAMDSKHAKVLEKSKFEAIKKANPNIRVEHLEDWNDDQDLLNQLLNL